MLKIFECVARSAKLRNSRVMQLCHIAHLVEPANLTFRTMDEEGVVHEIYNYGRVQRSLFAGQVISIAIHDEHGQLHSYPFNNTLQPAIQEWDIHGDCVDTRWYQHGYPLDPRDF